MTAPAFPVSQLGRPTVNYSLKPDDLRVRADTVSGLANSYNGSNAALTTISVKWEWGADNYAVFQDWYRNDCKDGSIEFTIAEMYLFGSMGGLTARFTASPKATYKAWNHYSVSATLETRTTDYITEATLDAALPTDPHTDNVTWPSDLFGYPSGDGYGEQAQSSSLRGKTEGYARPAMRRNSPITVTQVPVKWEISQANKILFDAWYHYKLVNGAAWFWIYTQFHGVWQYIKVRFVESISVEYEPMDWWQVSGTLETVPCIGQTEPIQLLPISDVPSLPSGGSSHPYFTTQPASQSLRVGSKLVLSVAVAGDYPITYQWYLNDVIITGATSPRYTVQTTQLTNAGTYYVIAENTYGSVTSNNAVIDVYGGTIPVITTHPSSTVKAIGATATFSVVATSNVTTSGPLKYTWYNNGAIINTATSSSYSKTNVQLANDGDQIYVLVGNDIGNTRSNTATFRIGYVPTITTQPVAWSGTAGASLTLTVVADSHGFGTLHYQWYKGYTAISGATSASYTKTAASGDAGSYSVDVSNNVGLVTSNSATVTVYAHTLLLIQVDAEGNIVERTGNGTITTSGTVIVDHTTTHDGYGSIRNTAAGSTTPAGKTVVDFSWDIGSSDDYTFEGWVLGLGLSSILGTRYLNFWDSSPAEILAILTSSIPVDTLQWWYGYVDFGIRGSSLLNSWHHLAVTRQSGTVRSFVDGIIKGTASATNTYPIRKMRIGNSSGTPCCWENIRISDIARYTENFTPPGRF